MKYYEGITVLFINNLEQRGECLIERSVRNPVFRMIIVRTAVGNT